MKKLLYITFIFSVLLMSWDFNTQDMAIASNQDEVIPNEAIRLRIIANSDSTEDQWLKRKIRDEVVAEIDPWVESLADINDARNIISEHIPELQELVDNTIEESGFNYQTNVELGVVPFPTKMYGQIVYPAGDYEALRITIGEAEGQNWWCVLFPPLCFVDMSQGEAVHVDQPTSIEQPIRNTTTDATEDVQVRFFLFEVIIKLISYIKGIF